MEEKWLILSFMLLRLRLLPSPPSLPLPSTVILDRNLFARTTSKQKGDILFWGEHFEFSNLPNVQTVTVNIYRESGSGGGGNDNNNKKKKKNKTKNVLLGVINIPTSSLNCGQMVERYVTYETRPSTR